ncbi:MAG: TnsA endonuclease N-terminal domain-containing protein [Parvularcula sp.]|jgi:hypothetical protein|nr:TnsA endonuclease N-terminal domain-containing protein [Parvularcula sp.]
MAKRKRTQTEAVMRNREQQGRGKGVGPDYKPWLLVQDVPSRGRASRIASNGRVVHTLSDLETAAFRDFQWDPDVIDIQEQYPISREATLRIAEDMKVRHPSDGKPRTPIVVTTDFLVTYRRNGRIERHAYAVKEAAAIDVASIRTRKDRVSIHRTRQKLEIERRYWGEQNVPWELLTDKELSKIRKANIEFILDVKPDPARPDGYWEEAMRSALLAVTEGGCRELDEIGRSLAAQGVLPRNDFTTALRILCARRILVFDMNRKFELSRPASDFSALRRVDQVESV